MRNLYCLLSYAFVCLYLTLVPMSYKPYNPFIPEEYAIGGTCGCGTASNLTYSVAE